MGIDEVIPCELAPSVEMIAAGITVSVAPSKGDTSPIASRNSNSPTASKDQNSPNQATHEDSLDHSTNSEQSVSSTKSTSEPAMDFETHSPEFQQTFAGLKTCLDLTVGAFSFFVNNLGTQDLTEPRLQWTSNHTRRSSRKPLLDLKHVWI